MYSLPFSVNLFTLLVLLYTVIPRIFHLIGDFVCFISWFILFTLLCCNILILYYVLNKGIKKREEGHRRLRWWSSRPSIWFRSCWSFQSFNHFNFLFPYYLTSCISFSTALIRRVGSRLGKRGSLIFFLIKLQST